jgi:hypothetical protein
MKASRTYLEFVLSVMDVDGEYTVGLRLDFFFPLQRCSIDKISSSGSSNKPVEEEQLAQL